METTLGVCNMIVDTEIFHGPDINYLKFSVFQKSDTAGTFVITINGVTKEEVIKLASNLIAEASKM